ncbi:MAG: hypothetical protein JWN21_1685 [Sphingomonas bacterium]|uniref:hypothetical protein n=1 Tax=Sphingomonas bacterium TaxID=1895847 RepID=UPI0026033D2C|nr:hypothetical protein [Sphingomonas bacterium]MDB5696142.1 hypothetical protein [Sphingomonas bacterium]
MKTLLALLALAATSTAPVDQVADALAAGEAALMTGRHEALLAAADRLDRLGARGDGTAAGWRARALAAGVRPRTPWRGRATGPAYRHGELPGGAEMVTEQVFLAGESAHVAVVPAGHPLRVRITGPDGAAVCEQQVTPPRVACRWLPVFTRRFKISIGNPGVTPARYYLVSN